MLWIHSPHWKKWIRIQIRIRVISKKFTVFFWNLIKSGNFYNLSFLIVKILGLNVNFFCCSFWLRFCPLDPDPDPGSQNLADPTDPDPKHWFQGNRRKSDILIFAWRVTWNYAYHPLELKLLNCTLYLLCSALLFLLLEITYLAQLYRFGSNFDFFVFLSLLFKIYCSLF